MLSDFIYILNITFSLVFLKNIAKRLELDWMGAKQMLLIVSNY